MSRRKTHEEYVSELAIKNPTVKVVGTYINAKTKITHYCLIHNVYWDTLPYAPLRGHGCPMCHKDRLREAQIKTNEQYLSELNDINSDIIPLEEYAGINIPILHKCLKHGTIWKITPYNALQGHGCYKCGIEKNRCKFSKPHEQYVEEVAKINSNIIVIGTYVNNITPILHRCAICNNEWYTNPTNILCGCGCPKCSRSKGEIAVEKWLEDNNINFISQKKFNDCCDKQPLPFDFYLPDYNVACEFQGIQHYEPVDVFGGQEQFELQIKHDKIKSNYCKQNNIRLLCIKYDEDVDTTLTDFLFI